MATNFADRADRAVAADPSEPEGNAHRERGEIIEPVVMPHEA
jgi:hypothetical protein